MEYNEQRLDEMSDHELQSLREAIDKELSSRELGWYAEVMEDPVAYTERVTNPMPFDSDLDIKDYLHEQSASDPDFWDRQSDRHW